MKMSYVKHLVSKKKRRFIEDGFDLDLAYIKPNIVAMGFPSENLEGVFRNNSDDVIRFLELKHKGRYKVYNLCSERSYDPAKFGNRVSVFGFDDHNAPPFELMLPCCKDMDKWLQSNPENVAIVHCKAGKGRTGVMICAYLLYKQHFFTAVDAMNYYAEARTENKKGVTIPSQRRYITYFSYFVRNNFQYVPKTVLLHSMSLVGIPTYNSGTCSPSVLIYQTKVILHKSKTFEKKGESEIKIDLGSPVPICGDIKIDVFHKDLFKKERMFVFWFNTYFLEHGVTKSNPNGEGVKKLGEDKHGDKIIEYDIPKFFLDKANKDKKHKLFPETLMVRLNIRIPKSGDAYTKVDGNTMKGDRCKSNERKSKTSNSLPNTKKDSHISFAVSRDSNQCAVSPTSPDQSPTDFDSPCSDGKLQYLKDSSVDQDVLTVDTRNLSISMETLRVEDEPLSSEDDDEEMFL